MWVARDKDGTLNLYLVKPVRDVEEEIWHTDDWEYPESEFLPIYDIFPDLKWEDDPIEVELTKVNRHYTQCNKCGKAFSYLPKDVEIVSVCIQPSSGYEDDFEVVKCPHCKSDVYL